MRHNQVLLWKRLFCWKLSWRLSWEVRIVKPCELLDDRWTGSWLSLEGQFPFDDFFTSVPLPQAFFEWDPRASRSVLRDSSEPHYSGGSNFRSFGRFTGSGVCLLLLLSVKSTGKNVTVYFIIRRKLLGGYICVAITSWIYWEHSPSEHSLTLGKALLQMFTARQMCHLISTLLVRPYERLTFCGVPKERCSVVYFIKENKKMRNRHFSFGLDGEIAQCRHWTARNGYVQ